MVSITVGGETTAELRAALSVAIQLIGGADAAVPAGAATPESVKGKPGRPPKAINAGPTAAEMAAAMGLSTDAPAPAPAPAVVTITEEQIRAKLKELMAHRTGDADETAGMVRVQTVLGKVGAQQIKQVPANRYAELANYIDMA